MRNLCSSCVARYLPIMLAVLLAAAGSAASADAQVTPLAVSDTLWEIHLSDGSDLVGRVIAVEGDRITVETSSGTRIEFDRSQLASVRMARGTISDGEYWPPDPNSSRLFFSPTGRTLRAGEGYIGVYEVFIPFVAFGVTNALTLAGGSPFYLGPLGGELPPFYIAPKLRLIQKGNTSVSAGFLAVYSADNGIDEGVGIAYGVGSFGPPDASFSTGIGWGFVGGDFSAKPVVMLGGEYRLSRSLKLLTENLVVPGEGLVYSAGVRFFGERLSADAGLAGITEGGCCLPIVNFVYSFGGSR